MYSHIDAVAGNESEWRNEMCQKKSSGILSSYSIAEFAAMKFIDKVSPAYYASLA